jgi:hypothetical protein
MKRFIPITFFFLSLLTVGCQSGSTSHSDQSHRNGEVSYVPIQTPAPVATAAVEIVKTDEEILAEQGYQKVGFNNGIMPNCYNYTPRYGDVENELAVTVGSGADVAIKVMSVKRGKCIRYVFINSGSTYSIKNIPEDCYYLKIAYGHQWIAKTNNGLCEGRFLSDAKYEKGEDILDFNRQETVGGYRIPSFSLKLDVISDAVDNTFNSSGISESNFNN